MVKRTGLSDPNAYEEKPRHFNAYFIANKEGNNVTGNFPVNIKFAYTF